MATVIYLVPKEYSLERRINIRQRIVRIALYQVIAFGS